MMALALVRVNDGVLANEGDKIWLAALDDSATGSPVTPLEECRFSSGTATFDIGYVDIYIVTTYVDKSLRP